MSRTVHQSRYIEARQILRFGRLREQLAAAAKGGKSYIASYTDGPRAYHGRYPGFGRDRSMRRLATREAVEAAIALLADRQQRVAARQHREAALVMGLATMRAELKQRREERAERTRQAVEAAIRPHYDACRYDQATAGEHTFKVWLGEIAATWSESSKGDTYSRRCTWRRTDSAHRLTVPARWRERVERRGLATLGSRLVLDARRVRGQDAVYEMVWVEQGRGFSLDVERGRVLVAHEYAESGGDDMLQIDGVPRVVAYSDEGVVIRSRDGRIVQVVVRDATTGKRHQITVPPKYGRDLAKGKVEADRVHAAIAWTFGLRPDQYRPELVA